VTLPRRGTRGTIAVTAEETATRLALHANTARNHLAARLNLGLPSQKVRSTTERTSRP
jgi:hypothetical protein